MSTRYFTSDWHLGMETLLNKNVMGDEVRNFKDVEEMDSAIIASVNKQVSKGDTIIHVGDLACFNSKSKMKPSDCLDKITATVINIHGNHDTTNRVKSLCSSLRLTLGKKYTAVSVSHYPTYDRRAQEQFLEGDIHICGHVHGKWKHCFDLTNKCLNINVGIDAWNFKLLSEDDLIKYIDKVLHLDKALMNKIKIMNGKAVKV